MAFSDVFNSDLVDYSKEYESKEKEYSELRWYAIIIFRKLAKKFIAMNVAKDNSERVPLLAPDCEVAQTLVSDSDLECARYDLEEDMFLEEHPVEELQSFVKDWIKKMIRTINIGSQRFGIDSSTNKEKTVLDFFKENNYWIKEFDDIYENLLTEYYWLMYDLEHWYTLEHKAENEESPNEETYQELISKQFKRYGNL